jgi:hypothetical protein
MASFKVLYQNFLGGTGKSQYTCQNIQPSGQESNQVLPIMKQECKPPIKTFNIYLLCVTKHCIVVVMTPASHL